jgi:hypothetical protein
MVLKMIKRCLKTLCDKRQGIGYELKAQRAKSIVQELFWLIYFKKKSFRRTGKTLNYKLIVF